MFCSTTAITLVNVVFLKHVCVLKKLVANKLLKDHRHWFDQDLVVLRGEELNAKAASVMLTSGSTYKRASSQRHAVLK